MKLLTLILNILTTVVVAVDENVFEDAKVIKLTTSMYDSDVID